MIDLLFSLYSRELKSFDNSTGFQRNVCFYTGLRISLKQIQRCMLITEC